MRIPKASISTRRRRYNSVQSQICFNSHFLPCIQWFRPPIFFAVWCLPPSLSCSWPRPQNRRKPSTVCSQARAVYEETWSGWDIQSPGRRSAGRRIKRRRRRRSVRFELRNSGREHVSGEWATVHRIIVVLSRQTQEGPGTGNWLRHTDTLVVVVGMSR